MNSQLLYGLVMCETDVDGALRRFCGDETLYCACLIDFLGDPTIEELNRSIAAQAWDEAFTAAHALKGLAGNMGFVPLFHAVSGLVVLIRAGKLVDIDASFHEVRRCYKDICSAIRSGDGAA